MAARVPAGLGARGRALWSQMDKYYKLDPIEQAPAGRAVPVVGSNREDQRRVGHDGIGRYGQHGAGAR